MVFALIYFLLYGIHLCLAHLELVVVVWMLMGAMVVHLEIGVCSLAAIREHLSCLFPLAALW